MSDEQPPVPSDRVPDEREWIPVAPPHPYAAPSAQQRKPGGKVFPILSMALGLVSLLTVIVAALYLDPGWIFVGTFIGLLAIGFGITAFVGRGRPLAAAITGTAAGGLSVVLTAVFIALLVFVGSGVSQVELEPADGSESEEWTPETEQESLIAWPSNMASGGVLFTGPGDPRPLESAPLATGASPEPNQVDRSSGNDVLIYVDYRCPHCSVFEQTNAEVLEQLVSSGDATVEIVPLSFLDRGSDTYYSSRAAGAVVCIVDAQPEAAWTAHSALLSDGVQPTDTAGLTNDQIIEAIDAAGGSLGSAAQDCIRNETFVTFAQALNNWVFANPIPNTVESQLQLQGTPTVLVNGVLYEGASEDRAAFQAFLEEHLN